MSGTPAEEWQNPLRDKLDKRMPRIAGPCAVIIFGVTGDLATKKLMPAIYDLANRGLLPPTFSLVGFGRRDWSDQDFADVVLKAVQGHARTPFRQEVWDRLSEGIRFAQGEFDDDKAFERLSETLAKLDAERGTGGNHAFYLSIPPKAFPSVCEQLSKSGLARPEGDRWSRVVIEKPFGHDLDSARSLNKVVNSVFPETSVFRIDHYLGKETVQNILALRFANQLFDPIWNAHYVDHVQITMAEDIGLGGRGGYYDGVGAARDVIQNHLTQLLALTAMEEPVSFKPSELQAEKIKVLSATKLVEPLSENTSRGQYTAGWQGGEKVVGLLEEEGFSPTSTTETWGGLYKHLESCRCSNRHGRCPPLPGQRFRRTVLAHPEVRGGLSEGVYQHARCPGKPGLVHAVLQRGTASPKPELSDPSRGSLWTQLRLAWSTVLAPPRDASGTWSTALVRPRMPLVPAMALAPGCLRHLVDGARPRMPPVAGLLR